MIQVYRLQSGKYPANSGKGAALFGGRWNRPGVEAIYTASSRSLAALEILAHYEALPKDFVVTPVRIPSGLTRYRVSRKELPSGWDSPTGCPEAQLILERHMDHLVIAVPSAIVPDEWNYILNPAHPDFPKIQFLKPEPFRFDPRLKPRC